MNKPESSVDRLYDKLRQMAVNFEFKPEERINESALSANLGASRTPLREALNRLVAEGFLTFSNGRGFFCRALSPARILELYEARIAIECEALRRATDRASEEQLAALSAYLDRVEGTYKTCKDLAKLIEMDEEFHFRIAELSNNSELLRILTNINDRIRYVRIINLDMLIREEGEAGALSSHRVLLNALLSRDADTATEVMRDHIERRRDQVTEAVRRAYSQLYVP